MAGALIVTAEIGPQDFSWLERLRQANYPPERNRVAAHLTIFHVIAPSAEHELRRRLGQTVRRKPPAATLAGLMDLGGGVAYRVVSEDLEAIRHELAQNLHGLLTAQDSGGWRPHITIQNKAAPKVGRALKHQLERDFAPRALTISGLGLHRYLDGPWEPIEVYSFRV